MPLYFVFFHGIIFFHPNHFLLMVMSDGVPKEGLRISDVLVRVAILQLIGEKVCCKLVMAEFYARTLFFCTLQQMAEIFIAIDVFHSFFIYKL